MTSCTPKPPLYHAQSYVFGTLVDVLIYGEAPAKAESAANDIFKRFRALHQQLHAWKPSELTKINDAFATGQTPIKINAEIEKIIRHAKMLSTQSKGMFNPAIGHLIQTWGFHQNTFSPKEVDQKQIKTLLASKASMANIKIKDGEIYSNNPNVKLDLGGYVKGYALDQALNHLKRIGIKHALINIGGNVIALGQHGEKRWRVGIKHPRKPSAIATIDLASGWAIGTSGDYQRFFIQNGQRFCHIINPATGYPANNVQSVSVLIAPQTNAGVLSDVGSKPIFVAPKHQQAEAANKMGINHYLIIESENKIRISAALARRVQWLNSHTEKKVAILQ